MGGCTNCSQKGGCEGRKATERELLAEIMPRLYPTGRWGEPDDAARFGAGVSSEEVAHIATAAALAARAPVFVRPGDSHETCDYLYFLCVGREPGLVELREGATIELPDGDVISERYLRLALSHVARVASLQEVLVEARRDEDGGFWIREAPRDGVFDPVLLKRTRKIISTVVGHDVAYLDFGVIDRPYPGFQGGDYSERYGAEPATINYLFFPQPATAASTVFVPALN